MTNPVDVPMTFAEALEVARTELFGETGLESLSAFLSCEAFERRFSPQEARAFKAAAILVNHLVGGGPHVERELERTADGKAVALPAPEVRWAVHAPQPTLTAGQLIEALSKMPADARVTFDTDAARFHTHLVDVTGCWYEPEVGDMVRLTSSDPREI